MILGTASLVVALFLYWRSQIPGIFAWQSRDVSMIGSSGAVFPSGVEFSIAERRFQGSFLALSGFGTQARKL